MGTFTTEIETDLGNFKRESEVVFVFDDIAGEWNGVVETKGLTGIGFGFGGFYDLVNLFFGVAASFGKEDFGAFDGGGFDIKIAVLIVRIVDFEFEGIKSLLNFW